MTIDVTKSVIDQYWLATDPRLGRILSWMESMEDWVVDEHSDILHALQDVSSKMEKATPEAVSDQAEDWLTLLAYLSSSRSIRFLEWMEHHPRHQKAALDLVQTARSMDDDPPALLLLDRLQVLKRLNLLSKVFAPQRMAAVHSLLSRLRNE